MSLFTKRRKVVRQKQEEDRKCWEENSKKFGKGCEDTIKTCKYLQEQIKIDATSSKMYYQPEAIKLASMKDIDKKDKKRLDAIKWIIKS